MKKTIEAYIKETPGMIPDDCVFKSRKGNNIPISRQRAYKIINNAAEDLGLVEINSKGIIVSGEIGTHIIISNVKAFIAGTFHGLDLSTCRHI